MYQILFTRKTVYILCSFLAGFSLMTIELLASRIVAPTIGNSVYTWTSIIGIILLGLSVGSFIGGIMVDKFNNKKILPIVFLLSAFSTSLISPLSHNLDKILNISDSVIILNILITIYLFLLPAIIMGMIQPIILKKYSEHFSKIGSEYGVLSATWSLGSILGVFMTGFFFISTIGTTETIYLISFILGLTSLTLAFIEKEVDLIYSVFIFLIILIIFFFLPTDKTISAKNIVYKKETAYYQVKVVDFNLFLYGNSRTLVLDLDTHSLESQNIIPSQYTEIYPAFEIFNPEIKEILTLGGGAYTLPKHFKEYYPEANVSVVEIDPEIKKVAEEYFNLQGKEIKTIIGDARQIINNTNKKYDLIFGDVFSSFISVPGNLLTMEFNEKVKEKLNPEGIYAINFISSLTGENSELYKSVRATFSKSFPNYYILGFGYQPEQIQSIVLIGLNSPNHLTEEMVKNNLKQVRNPFLADRLVLSPEASLDEKVTILTDNFYPLEKLMNNLTRDYFPNHLSFLKQII